MIKLVNRVGRKVWRAGAGLLILGALAACDPVPVGDTTCKSAFACELNVVTAKSMRADIGRDFGGGVVLRNARAVGQSLVVDLSLPFSSTAFSEPAGQRVIQNFGKNLASGFCSTAYANDFFKMGNTVRARGFSRDNKLVADQVIHSCGGKKR